MSWMNSVQSAVDSAVNDVSRAADNVAERIMGQSSQQEHQHQQQAQHQQPPFPFFFGQRTPAPYEQQQNANKVPVASARSIRQLPTIRVAPEDLVDESNRECCICLEP